MLRNVLLSVLFNQLVNPALLFKALRRQVARPEAHGLKALRHIRSAFTDSQELEQVSPLLAEDVSNCTWHGAEVGLWHSSDYTFVDISV
jgi:hypothetical protein